MKLLPHLADFWAEHPEYDGLEKEFASYALQWSPLGASPLVNVSAIMTTDKRSDFIATAMSASTTVVGNAAYGPNTAITLNLVHLATARTVQSMPLDVLALMGAQQGLGQLPAFTPEVQLPWPMIFQANTQVQCFASNQSATPVNLWVTFDGVKVYLPSREPHCGCD